MNRPPRIYISAGEPSGDAHGAAVASALRRRIDVEIEALGGPELEAAGATVLDRMDQYSVVGFVEALWKVPAHVRLLGRVSAAFRAGRYDLAILVDYPGYHLRAAAAIAKAGVPVLYYIAPQMWAWAPWRVRRLASVRRLAVILPFEEAFFREHNVSATFVGHPLVRPGAAAEPAGSTGHPRARSRPAGARPVSRQPVAGGETPLAGVPRRRRCSRRRAARRAGGGRRDAARDLPRRGGHAGVRREPAGGVRGRGCRAVQVRDDDARGGTRRRAHGDRLSLAPGVVRDRKADRAGPPRWPREPDRGAGGGARVSSGCRDGAGARGGRPAAARSGGRRERGASAPDLPKCANVSDPPGRRIGWRTSRWSCWGEAAVGRSRW